MLYLLFILGTIVPLSTQHGVASETILQNKTTSMMILREYNASSQHNASINNDWIKCRGHSDCLHGGSCEFGANNVLACRCQLGWTGIDCGTITCETEGSCVRGTCEYGRHCVCDKGWHGFYCNESLSSIKCNDEIRCDHGYCVNETCICRPGFHGTRCNVYNCDQGECGPNGRCAGTHCECDAMWSGTYCDQYSPVLSSENEWTQCQNASHCLNGGSCELDESNVASCTCQKGWTGVDCSDMTCESEGSCVHGSCMHGKHCVCDPGWRGYFCNESLSCDGGIRCENGDCINGTCICQPGFHGAACDVFNCSEACGANGRCADDSSHCEYDTVWSGSICELGENDWITFQRRRLFDIGFNKTFSEYERGFGGADGVGDFWLGLQKLHTYTKHTKWDLRIDVVAFNGSRFYSEYSGFKVLEPPMYNITFTAWTGGTLDSYAMDYHMGAPFSARDRDQDNSSGSCSSAWGSNGWWFRSCYRVYLNTDRATSSTVNHSRMLWWTESGWIPLIGSTMKMRLAE